MPKLIPAFKIRTARGTLLPLLVVAFSINYCGFVFAQSIATGWPATGAQAIAIEINFRPSALGKSAKQPGIVSTKTTLIQPAGQGRRPRIGSYALRRSSTESDRPASPLSGPETDWNNFGGNPQRNGLSSVTGPNASTLLWENNDDFAIISSHPVIVGDQVFAVRMRDFITNGAEDDLVAYDLDAGIELWRVLLPFAGNTSQEWSAHVLGAHHGRVFATRGGNGNSVEAPIYAYDAADGSLIWTSMHETGAGPEDGAVFTANGDLVVADLNDITRINATDGTTVWSVPRHCPSSGGCAAVINSNGVFICEPVAGGNVVTKYDLESGVFLYSSAILPGLTSQNAPFVSADGNSIFFARSQNNAAYDFLYAFNDTGEELVTKWSRAVRWTVFHIHGIGPDGSIYTFLPGDEFVRLDPQTGDVLDSAGTLSPIGTSLAPRTSVAADGTVYVSNGWAGSPATQGRIWAFSSDLQSNFFTLTLDRQNSGGPALGRNGTLVVADRVGVRAYRTPSPFTIHPDSVTALRGQWASGTLVDVFDSDDSYLNYQAQVTANSSEAPVCLIVDGASGDPDLSSIQLLMESQAGTPGLTAILEAWNWTENEYDIVDSSATRFNIDAVVTVDLSNMVSDYVQPGSGSVRARVGWRKTGLTINFPWEVRLDQLVWNAY